MAKTVKDHAATKTLPQWTVNVRKAYPTCNIILVASLNKKEGILAGVKIAQRDSIPHGVGIADGQTSDPKK